MHTTKNEHVFRVMAALEQIFQVCRDEILSPSRPDEIAFARQVGMVALMEIYGYSTTFAARAMGRTDHGTAIHARLAVMRRTARSERDSANFQAVLDLLRQADIDTGPMAWPPVRPIPSHAESSSGPSATRSEPPPSTPLSTPPSQAR